MVERPKGNILYEILIVVLVVVLIGTILYPKKIWNRETEFEDVCHVRMETVLQLEFQFLFNQNMCSDSIPEVKENVMADTQALMALDTIIKWDNLVTQDEFEQIFRERIFPEDLRTNILNQLSEKKPLGSLASWDDIEYKLLDLVKEAIKDSATVPEVIDRNVIWPVLFGETRFFDLIENTEMSRSIRQRTLSAINRGIPVTDTDGWRSIRPEFVKALEEVIQQAESTDFWGESEKDEWEKQKRITWESTLDTLSESGRDTLWEENKRDLWEKRKELIWMKDRGRLWKSEGNLWAQENIETWKRVLDEQWEKERKREWLKGDGEGLPDSLKGLFSTKKDSLWRFVIDDLKEEEFGKWAKKNQDKEIQNLWENDRRLTWERERYIQWNEDKESDKAALWKELKEEIWKSQKDFLWKEEEERGAMKAAAKKKLDSAIVWINLLGEEEVNEVIANLQLPNNSQMLKIFKQTMKTRTKTRGSALNDLGLTSLFRDQLIDETFSCPVALSSYLVVLPDSLKRQVEIHCPISDTSRTTHTIKIDPLTKDTTYTDLKVPFGQKLFGGAKIYNHGNINREGKQSWTKRGQ